MLTTKVTMYTHHHHHLQFAHSSGLQQKNKTNESMHQYLLSGALRIIGCFLCILAAVANTDQLTDEISINCGSTGASVSMNGRRWLGDIYSNLTIHGSSTRSTVTEEPTNSADPVPYKTARISRSRFSYIFQVNSGQKLIRLHFNPSSYNGFRRSKDLFTVQAGRFILLSNFSASITADALAVNFLTKEFCIITEENYALNVTFSPATACCQSQDTHAFVNGIEVISVPETLSYCHTGDTGVQVLGEKFLVYIDNKTAFEMVHRHNVKRGSVSSSDDLGGMFGMWPEVFSPRNKVNNFTWRISVDVGFMYLVRFHFCELDLKMEDNRNNSFSLFINHMVACTDAHFLGRRKDNCGLLYRNYIVMAKGPKLEGKRGITISLQPKHKFICGHGPLEGFEIFKLSNHDYNLGSPNLLPPEQDLPFRTCPDMLSVLGSRHAVATAVIIIVSLINVIVHILRQTWEANFPEEKKPTTRVTRTCRYFSLTEIRAATKEFNDSFIIGMGGFGRVYKGFINDGPEIVAIKRLKPNSKQGKREFWTEVETLSELRHVNLVSLIGYCNEQKEMILVYDYMPNGTLADHLYRLARKNKKYSYLSWEERLAICIGAGRGLDYLHTGKGVIHRDVKATNILLDETFVAKVSDFGLAKTGCVSGLQNQDSTNLQGTFGYIDPDYFKTRKLTTKSDTYAFGVVLLEVLCGRPAVDPLAAEDEHSLTMWARDNISRGKVDQILAPSLRGGISPDSLKTFLEIVESCLHDEPNKRPPIVLVVIALEFALVQQNDMSLVPNDIASFANFLPFTNRSQQENASYLVPNEIGNAADVMQCVNRTQLENPVSALPNEITADADVLPHVDRMSMQLNMPSSHVQSMASLMKEVTSNRIVNAEQQHEKIDGRKTLKHKLSRLFRWISARKRAKPSQRAGFGGISISAPIIKNVNKMTSLIKEQITGRLVHSEPPNGKNDGRKSVIHKLSRLFPWNSVPKREQPSKRTDFAGISMSAPITKYVSNKTSSTGSSAYQKMEVPTEVGTDDVISTPNFRIFSFSELKIATTNFKADLVLGEGGFGRVYKGGLEEKSTDKNGIVSFIAIKRLNHESWQGFDEWLNEINFLGTLSHPNLVKLLGYCREDKELLLVYEFMQRGSLDHYLFQKSSATQTLPWNIRLKILIGAARGLAHLHTLNAPVIYRDFKTSNILLDRSYNAKLSDFGLAKLGPFADHSHVTTRVMGTYGYCAPEYVATGHLYVKSDVYGFGVVLLEMLTGLRAFDKSRPSGQQKLVQWVKKLLVNQKRKVFRIMDPRLEGSYPRKSAFQACLLAKRCLENEPRRRPSMEEVVETLENLDLVAVNYVVETGYCG